MPKTTKTIIAKKISFNLTPEEFEKFEELRGSKSYTDFIKNKILNNIIISDNILNNTDIINTELREITSKMMLYEDILRKLVPKMVATDVSVEFSDREYEVVKKFA